MSGSSQKQRLVKLAEQAIMFHRFFPSSRAVVSVWNNDDVFKMKVKGVSSLKCIYAATTRVLDRSFR